MLVTNVTGMSRSTSSANADIAKKKLAVAQKHVTLAEKTNSSLAELQAAIEKLEVTT